MSYTIDWATLGFKSARLGSATTITTTSEYQQVAVPGMSLTLDGPVGSKWLIIENASISRPSGANSDVYLRIHQNGTSVSASMDILSTAGAQSNWSHQNVITTTTASDTITMYISGGAVGNYGISANASIVAIRVA